MIFRSLLGSYPEWVSDRYVRRLARLPVEKGEIVGCLSSQVTSVVLRDVLSFTQ